MLFFIVDVSFIYSPSPFCPLTFLRLIELMLEEEGGGYDQLSQITCVRHFRRICSSHLLQEDYSPLVGWSLGAMFLVK